MSRSSNRQNDIEKSAKQLNWDISKYKIINEPEENNTAKIAARLASEEKIKIKKNSIFLITIAD